MAILDAGNGKDPLKGTDAADTLFGGNGKDIVVGKKGDEPVPVSVNLKGGGTP